MAIGFAGLSLSIERGKGKIEIMVGGLAGVDGAAREGIPACLGGIESAQLAAEDIFGKP
jgi:hypothetical protein